MSWLEIAQEGCKNSPVEEVEEADDEARGREASAGLTTNSINSLSLL
jgi:hypothetical protein